MAPTQHNIPPRLHLDPSGATTDRDDLPELVLVEAKLAETNGKINRYRPMPKQQHHKQGADQEKTAS